MTPAPFRRKLATLAAMVRTPGLLLCKNTHVSRLIHALHRRGLDTSAFFLARISLATPPQMSAPIGSKA